MVPLFSETSIDNNLPTNMIHSLSHWPLISSWSQAFRRFCHGDTLEAHRAAVKSALDPVESVGGRWWPRTTLQLDVFFFRVENLTPGWFEFCTWKFKIAKLETRNLCSPENQVGVYMSIVLFFPFRWSSRDGWGGLHAMATSRLSASRDWEMSLWSMWCHQRQGAKRRMFIQIRPQWASNQTKMLIYDDLWTPTRNLT